MSVEVARRHESSATMLNFVLKRNHELYRGIEQERFKSDYKSSDSNYMSCEETVLGCLDWNQKNLEEKVEFMIRTPDQWSGSFIRPTNGFCRIHKVVLDQNIPIPRPEVDAISFVKYTLKHSDGLLTPWDLMNCKENLYKEELYKRCEALLRQCLDWNRNNDKGLIQFAIKTPKIWNHEKIKARPNFQLVPDIEETTHGIQPHDQLEEYESCSRQNSDIIGQIEQTEIFNISETLHYIETIKDYFDHNKTTHRRTPKQTFNTDGDIIRRHDRDITRRQYECFDILLAPAKNPNAIPKMSSWHKVYRKPNPEEKVKAVENPATQTDALSDKKNASFEISFEKPKNVDAKPMLSLAKRKTKYEDFYDGGKQESDYQTSVQQKNSTKQIEGEKQYQQAGTEIESIINPEDYYGYPQWAVRPLLPIHEAPTPVEMGLVSARNIEMNTFLSLERNKQEAYRVLDRKAIKYEPERFRFSSLHRFSERPSRIPIMVANPYENRMENLRSRISRIPIRIKGYIWKTMTGKKVPASVQSFTGSLIPVWKTKIQGVYPRHAFSHNKNGEPEQNKIPKFQRISPEQSGKKTGVSSVNDVDFYMNGQLQEKVEISAISKQKNKKRKRIHNENYFKSKSVFPKPAPLPPIGMTSSYQNPCKQENVKSLPPPSPPATLPLLHTRSPRSPTENTMENSGELTSRPASVTGYSILPPIGGFGKPRLMSAAGKRQHPPIFSRPVSVAGYAKLPPISTTK